MNLVKKYQRLVPKRIYLEQFLRAYWFAPQDVLLRSVEANIVHSLVLKRPILDIGIGDGGMSVLLFPRRLRIDVGIDIDVDSLRKAAKTKRYKKVVRANAESLPFANESFESAVSNSTFEHIRRDKQAIAEVSRVLRPEGHFFLTVPTPKLQDIIMAFEDKRGEEGKEKLRVFNKRVCHRHYRSLEEWENIFSKNNLQLAFHKYYFPYHTTRVWYKLFKVSVKKVIGRELWSYLAHSPLSCFVPKRVVIFLLKKYVLKKAYNESLPLFASSGSMLFMVAKKLR